RREASEVEMHAGEPRHLRLLALGEEAVDDAALIEDLEGACMQAPRARPDQVLVGAPLDYGHIDARERQFARQHHPRLTTAGDDHRMLDTPHIVTPRLLHEARLLRGEPGLE